MSNPATLRIMDAVLAKGRKVIDETATEAEDHLRKNLGIPAAAAADSSFVISSAPGEYPRKRTGQLQGSVYNRVIINDGPRYFRDVGCSAPHSKFLEHGTSRMAARPHIKPTVDKFRPILMSRLRATYGK